MRIVQALAILLLTEAALLAQGTIPGLTSTPITFSGHADDFVAGPDGNVWLADSTANAIGRLAVDGSAYQAFPVPTPAAGLNSIVAGPDGNLWFTESSVSKVGRITTSGAITEFTVPAPFVYVLFGFVNGEGTIAAGPDGNLWISGSGQMARVTPQGAVTVLSVASPPGGDLFEIGKCVAGPDANLWCMSSVRIAGEFDNHPVKVTTAGVATLYPGFFGQYFDILSAPDGNLWISAEGASPPESLTRVTPAGGETVYTLPTTRESRLAVGADGNIWFTERTTMGNLWQLVLSTATDDGHATFNSAPITTSYPEGIIAVGSPAGTAGIHAEGAAPRCPAGEAFYVGTSAEYGENLTWCRTQAASTCTDLVAGGIVLRQSRIPGTNNGLGFCQDLTRSPDAALDPVLTIQLPPGSRIDNTVTDPTSITLWNACSIEGSGDLIPLIRCTAPSIHQGETRILSYRGVFEAGNATATCSSSTAEIEPLDNKEIFSTRAPEKPPNTTVNTTIRK
jgi:virginiamycin B lyase